jgi:hypothetical protein
VRCNGKSLVILKTIHGKFEFEMQKYEVDESFQNYFQRTGQMTEGYMSDRLRETCAYYSNRMSYAEVAKLIERISGVSLLSDQKIYQIVQAKAQQVSQEMATAMTEVVNSAATELINVKTDLELYNRDAEEILLFDDGIQVKAQSAQRQPSEQSAVKRTSAPAPNAVKSTVVLTDIMMLQTGRNRFEYFMAPIDEQGNLRLSLEQMIRAHIMQHYGTRQSPLPLVVIADGASGIRQRLFRVFGTEIVIILDWYHLCEKVRQLMSMIARSKPEKVEHIKAILAHLWHGRVQSALSYLKQQVNVRNQEKFQDLVGYLAKHQSEIIDYERRRQAGKTIGSGRMEKAVDQVIGHRQKHKGRSWRPQGSRALALLKILELNGKWQQAWFPTQSA